MAWHVDVEQIEARQVHRYMIADPRGPLSCTAVYGLWRGDSAFRAFFARMLGDSPFEAFFWETPPVTGATARQPFEFVLVDAPALAGVMPDPASFAGQFRRGEPVAVFPSLGGDAVLIAPAPGEPLAAYAHLASFLRRGPTEQVDALWRAVGETMTAQLTGAPRWLSTSGLGVTWLHMRIDSRPKYYTHAPYRRAG